jgi:hypothetical protein
VLETQSHNENRHRTRALAQVRSAGFRQAGGAVVNPAGFVAAARVRAGANEHAGDLAAEAKKG